MGRDEAFGALGAALLQVGGEPAPAACLPLHANLLGIRDGGGGAAWRAAWRLAGPPAARLLQPLEPRRIRPRPRTGGPVTDIWNDVLVYPLLTLLVIAYDLIH